MKKYKPRSPGNRLAQNVDIAALTRKFAEHLKSVSGEEVIETLRRYDDEYERRYPKNVPPIREY